ncbi:glycoside hydrolase family 16 protein [Kitasatospora phosalacinea]|uniref:glycoside hydrolase family 16 protein n=1 Tax=Kitasatospora phosalacinea TaxID=2065 RepID=UPI0009DDB00F|nr:hypothetical protein [Kitasatospora phosalacinea]
MSLPRRVALLSLLLVVPLLPAAPASAAPRIQQRSLAPTSALPDTPVAATLSVGSLSTCVTVDELGVGVRDADQQNLDFPGAAADVRICPEGYVLTTAARSFPEGTYTEFGWYRTGTEYHNLPSKTLTVSKSVTPPSPPPVPAGRLVFDENFTDPPQLGTTWNATTASAYRYGNHNPDDDKLDWLQPGALSTRDGANTFTATSGANRLENGKQSWDTGLLTTENTQQGFQVRPGDYAEVRLQLPSGYGAWPALWTWKDSGNEIDSFEYHPDNPNLLELSNRINSAGTYYTDADEIHPGAWVTIGVHYGAYNNDWYVNHKLVFSDHTGTGPNWSAYLILNLSICAGSWHPSPTDDNAISTAADYLRVWRPRA